MSEFLWPHGLQHARLPCPVSPRVCSNSCPLSWWYHTTILSSVARFSCPQSFPASGSFPMSWLFASGGQSIGDSASTSVLPMNIQGLFPLGLTGLISLLPRDSQESSPTPHFKSINSLVLSLLYGPTLTSMRYRRTNIQSITFCLCFPNSCLPTCRVHLFHTTNPQIIN